MILSSLSFSLSLIRFLLFFKSFARSHSCLFLSFSPFPLRSLLSLSSSFSTRGYLCSRFALIFFSLAAISTLFVSLSLSLSVLVPPLRRDSFLLVDFSDFCGFTATRHPG